jgi:LysR family hydrogen peroxide-inducible transcriptional activator
MEIHQLRYFLAVASTGSFSRAAELCHVAQPSLSQQIQKLERELKERLFDRERQGAVLTEAGERLLPRAERALGELQAAQQEIRDLRGQVSGPLRLGVLPTIAPYFLPRVLPAFLAEHPAVELSVYEETTQHLVQGLRDRDLDLALASPPLPAALDSQAIFSEELLVALPPGHRLAGEEEIPLDHLRDEAFILLHESHCLGEQALVYCHKNELRPRVSCRGEQLETVKQLIAAGLGVSLLPAMACAAKEETLVYRRMSEPRPSRAIHFLWGRQQSLSRAARAFRRFVAPALFGALALAGTAPASASPATPEGAACVNAGAGEAKSWTPWECVLEVEDNGGFLTGRKAYLNRLRVEFSASGAAKEKGYAAWDGETSPGKHRFVIRHLFPPAAGGASATWSFTTICEGTESCGPNATSPSLVTRGQVEVAPAPGGNRLERLGLLELRGGGFKDAKGAARKFSRLRQRGAGGPFPWIGDTAWAAPMKAKDEEWLAYLEDRARRGVTVVQVGPAPAWAGDKDQGGRSPFQRLSGCRTGGEKVVPTRCDQPHPDFWRAFESKIALANQQGLYVFLAGMMEPRSDHPAGNGPHNYPAAVEAANFAHWLAARLGGSFVVFSPAFDSPRIKKDGQDLQGVVGRELVKVNPRHLVTNHWATVELREIAGLHGENWLAFEMFQSGNNDGDAAKIVRRAHEMAAKISGAGTPADPAFAANWKPAVNGEAVYDHGGSPTQEYSGYRARQAGWTSLLSGAAGYSWGVGGIWDWGICGVPANDPANACKHQLGEGHRGFAEALAGTSARSMEAMARLWKSLGENGVDAAEQGRILEQAPEPFRQMVAGRTAAALLAYLPHNPQLRLRVAKGKASGFNPAAGLFFDPVKGVASTVAGGEKPNFTCAGPPGECTFTNRFYRPNQPSLRDRLLRLPIAPARHWPSQNGKRLEVFAGRLEDGAPWGTNGWLLDAQGRPAGKPFTIDATPGRQALSPAAAYDGQGGFLVVWQAAEDPGGKSLGIFGKRLAPSGEPAGDAFEIATTGEPASPTVALDPAGEGVVAWREIDPATGDGKIWARIVGRGEPALVAGGQGVDAGQPKAALGRDGALTIAWVENERKTGKETVRLRRYGTAKLAGTPATQQVNTVEAPGFWLIHLHFGDDGRVEVEYESRFGPHSGGVYLQAFDAGVKVGAETRLN